MSAGNCVSKAQACINKAHLFGFPPIKEVQLLEDTIVTLEHIIGHKNFTPFPLKIGGWKIVFTYKANNRVICYLIGVNNEGKAFFKKGAERKDYSPYSITSEHAFLMLQSKGFLRILLDNIRQ